MSVGTEPGPIMGRGQQDAIITCEDFSSMLSVIINEDGNKCFHALEIGLSEAL